MPNQPLTVIKHYRASTHSKHAAVLALSLLPLLVPFPTRAHPGDLDPTFGTGGKVLVHFTQYVGERGHGVVIQSDGKILLGGESNYGDAMARFTTNGALDGTFGSGGKSYQYTHGYPTSIAPVAGDKFIMAGGSWLSGITTQYFYMRRYNADGTLDSTFGNAGAVATDMGYYSFARDVAVQPDGKIVLVGVSQPSTPRYFGVARYNPDGSLDASFGSGGVLTTDFGKRLNDCASVAIEPDGKILVGGFSETGAEDASFAVARYLTNGVLDPSFNGNGKVTSNFGFGSEAYGVAVQNDGKVLLGGWVNFHFALARYNPDGTLDTSFGTNHTGLVMQNVGSWDSWTKIAVLPDGKILAIGQTATGGQVVVARYDPNGIPDPTFGVNGIALVALGSKMSEADALALQPDGKLLVAGTAWNTNSAYSDLALARLENIVVSPPTITCPGPATVECAQAAEITALVHDPGSLPLTVVWTVNGAFAQTNTLQATNGPVDVAVSLNAELPLGTNNVTVSVTDTMNQGDTCSTPVTVVDTDPPTILSASATPSALWPPNHQMVPVEVDAAVTDQCDAASWKIVEVLSNEPAKGQVEPDWLITGDHSLQLRAERSGAGLGRVYSIIIQASDSSGNLSSPRIVNVTVPKSVKTSR
jgi:uncharacterized delta-60 repeat protein